MSEDNRIYSYTDLEKLGYYRVHRWPEDKLGKRPEGGRLLYYKLNEDPHPPGSLPGYVTFFVIADPKNESYLEYPECIGDATDCLFVEDLEIFEFSVGDLVSAKPKTDNLVSGREMST